MNTWQLLARATSVVMLVAVAACSDSNPFVAPADSDLPLRAFFDTAPAPGFDAILRTDALENDIVVQKVISASGGRLSAAGISINVPEDALSGPTQITLRALAGHAMAVEFSPHGLIFNKSVEVLFDIDDTNVEEYFDDLDEDGDDGEDDEDNLSMSEFMGVYFERNSNGSNDAVEIFQLRFDDDLLILETTHFSGYVTASG